MNRKLEIDTVRGIACLMLVAYHVVGSPNTGLEITSGLLRDANDFLAYIRMPLFTFLSGYVYGWRPFQGNAGIFLAGKARRLLIPLLVVGTLFAICQTLAPGTNDAVENWYLLHIIPYAHFWFVESLFIIFIAIVLLESLGLLGTLYKAGVFLLVASILYVAVYGVEVFSIAGAIYLLPYFLAGLVCCRFDVTQKVSLPVLAAIWAGCLILLVLNDSYGIASKRSLAALIFGAASCVLLIKLGLKSRPLAFIGLYSYAVYLFHAFFTGASRIILVELGVTNVMILLIVGCILGIAGPMFIERIASQNRLSNTLLLGKKWTPALPWIYLKAH